MLEYKGNNVPGARRNGNVAQMILEESTPDNHERKDDRLVEELKNVFIISKNLDFGGLRYANSIKRQELKGHGSENLMQSSPVFEEQWEEGDGQFTGVHDENGEELEEDELALRQWEWIMAARVLDRALLWVSIVMGMVTFMGIFMRAPRLQELLFGSSNDTHSHCKD